MPLSPHYYALVLSSRTNRLYEAFRDFLIDVENEGFPVEAVTGTAAAFGLDPLRELVRNVDTSFGHHYLLEPLSVVVVGDEDLHSTFGAVTTHGSAVIGRIEGDHTTTSARDLGQIVWPVVKLAMSGVLDEAMRDLQMSTERGQIACGLEAVARRVNTRESVTLLVEDGYHQRGRIGGTSRSPILCQDIDVRESADDAVDEVVQRVLACGGKVVFTPRGSLIEQDRIVLLPTGEEAA